MEKPPRNSLHYGLYEAPVKFNGTTQQPSVCALRPVLIYKCFLGEKKKEYWKNTQQTKCLCTVHWNPPSPHSSTDINMQRRVDMHIKFPF